MDITFGAWVEVVDATGRVLPRRALTGIVDGRDFPVVWACSEREWDAAAKEGRDPEGTPWPAEDVSPASSVQLG